MKRTYRAIRWVVVKGDRIFDFSMATSRRAAIRFFMSTYDPLDDSEWKDIKKKHGHRTVRVTLTWPHENDQTK
ncbi:MAG TPA: hypothetical protein ENI23_09365 [bacterium]|nr:hypothetical protein [bacterium]